MSEIPAYSSESFEIQNETARLMIRAAAVVLSLTAVMGALALPVTPQPGGMVALAATLVTIAIAWWQVRRPQPRAFAFLLVWETVLAVSSSFAEGPVVNAQTMGLFTAVFLGVFLLEGRQMWIVLAYAWGVWAWMMPRVAEGLESDTVVQIAINHIVTLLIGTALMLILRRRLREVVAGAVARFHRLPIGAFRSTEGGQILDVNDPLVRLLGYDSREELMAINAQKLFLVEDRRNEVVAKAVRSGRVSGVEVELLRKDGSVFEARLALTAGALSDGTMVVEGALEDVGGLHRAERLARAAEERFTAAFQSAPIGMALVGSEGRLLRTNAALQSLVGLSEPVLETTSWFRLGRDDPVWKELVEGDGKTDTEHYLLRPDGTGVWVRASTTRVTDPEAGTFYVAQMVDVTSQRTLQETLEGIVRAKDEFIASVSHELRTPLTAVVGFADILANDADLSVDERPAIQQLVHSQAVSVSHIVEDLLVAARVANEQLSVNPRLIDLADVTRAAVADCDHSNTERHSIEIHGAARAWADPERVRQILRNLVTNAYRYGGSNIKLVLANSGDAARVSVVDDGSGVAVADAERIWEPYVSGSRSKVTTTDSIGLGLAVSRHLADLMGGSLTYQREDGSTTFELALPVHSQP
ncbi:MAG: PAS domain-containing sensor histidine kinase [Acidimicrobiia bacterium]|nr:PAS domain-containing sensor histidine kinase [Acidimicrobiia bacterium]